MAFGQIAESKNINKLIYRCFDDLLESEQRKFVKKFRQQPHDQAQVMHTMVELVCGAYLSSKGFIVIHEKRLNNLTPDWCIVDEEYFPQAIIELVNFHIDLETEKYIEEQKKIKKVIGYRRDGNRNNINRLYESIRNKAQDYCNLANILNLPYVIALHPDFLISLDLEEVLSCLASEEHGLFNLYPHFSGLLFFENRGAQYVFQYIDNSKCLRKFNLIDGYYP
jgi:hypothetical protein